MALSSLFTVPSSVCKGDAVVNIAYPYFVGTKVKILTLFKVAITKKNVLFLLLRQNKGRQPPTFCQMTISLSRDSTAQSEK